MKIALLELWGGDPSPHEVNDINEKDPDYVRVSEIVEINFVLQPDEIVVPLKLAALEERSDAIREEAERKLGLIEEQRKKLLALPSPAQEEMGSREHEAP